jgi:hypothetical protein
MDGKTFIKKYIKENPNIVMRTQFVIVSSSIRKEGKYERQVINANSLLYPSMHSLCDTSDFKNDSKYHNNYFNKLNEANAFLATLIKYSIEENQTIVFLCSYSERKYYYLKLLSIYINNIFNYPLIDYKKYKEDKKYKILKYDAVKVLDYCDKTLKKAQKDNKEKMMNNPKTCESYLKKLSKKDLKKELKILGFDSYDMNKSEMIDFILTMYS